MSVQVNSSGGNFQIAKQTAGDILCKPMQKGQMALADYFRKHGQLPKDNVQINGFVAPGFEPVKDVFSENFRVGHEKKAQLCVYHGEEIIVDLWASVEKDDTFGPNTLMNVFSSTKSITAIALAKVIEENPEKGINYDTKISSIWPEFKGKFKDEAKIKDLMRHELGIPITTEPIDPENLMTEKIKQNRIGEIFERHPLKYAPGSKREYHVFSRGMVANEIFRRIDSKGRTVGEYLREEISSVIGSNTFIGLTENETQNVEDLELISPLFSCLQMLLPAEKRAKEIDAIIRTSQTLMWPFILTGAGLLKLVTADLKSSWFGPEPIKNVPFLRLDKLIEYANSKVCRMGESPSTNGHCTARGMAKIAAVMANKGKFKDTTLISGDTWDAIHANPKPGKIALLPSCFTEGGVNMYTDMTMFPEDWGFMGREGFMGWMGFGGSVLQWHPDKKIGFGFCSSLIDVTDMNNNKGTKLQKAVQNCLESLEKK